jgi:hypothetical protein
MNILHAEHEARRLAEAAKPKAVVGAAPPRQLAMEF